MLDQILSVGVTDTQPPLLTLDNLASGFIGVVAGAFISLWLMRHEQAALARVHLASLLLQIGRKFGVAKEAVSEILDPVNVQVLAAGYEVSRTHWLISRRVYKKVGLLLGMQNRQYPGEQRSRFAISYPGLDDAKKHVDDLLNLLGYNEE